MNTSRITVFIVAAAILLLVSGLLARASIFVVDERELAVILQFGKPVRSIEAPGLYFKTPFIQEVRRLPRTLQFWRSTEDIVDLPTADGKKIEVSAWALWKIDDPLKFVQALRTVENGQLAVKDRVRAAVRDEVTGHNLAEVVRSTSRELTYSFRFELPDLDTSSSSTTDDQDEQGEDTVLTPSDANAQTTQAPLQPGTRDEIRLGREKILQQIKTSVRKRLEGEAEGEIDRGITLVDVGVSHIGFVPAVREAAFERLTAFMESIASGYINTGEQRKQEILNRTAAEVEEILGQGEEQARITRGKIDAEIIEKFAQAITETGDLYNFLKQLEVYEKSLNGQTRLILTTDSEIFQLLKESGQPGDESVVAPSESTSAPPPLSGD